MQVVTAFLLVVLLGAGMDRALAERRLMDSVKAESFSSTTGGGEVSAYATATSGGATVSTSGSAGASGTRGRPITVSSSVAVAPTAQPEQERVFRSLFRTASEEAVSAPVRSAIVGPRSVFAGAQPYSEETTVGKCTGIYRICCMSGRPGKSDTCSCSLTRGMRRCNAKKVSRRPAVWEDAAASYKCKC